MTETTKIALVKGSSRGLGKNTALALAHKGVGVIVTCHRNEAGAKAVVSQLSTLIEQLFNLSNVEAHSLMEVHGKSTE